MKDKDIERALMFLFLPKESQEKIIAEVDKVVNLVCELIREEAQYVNENSRTGTRTRCNSGA